MARFYWEIRYGSVSGRVLLVGGFRAFCLDRGLLCGLWSEAAEFVDSS